MTQQLKTFESLDIKNPLEAKKAEADLAKIYQDIEKSKAETSKSQAEARSISPGITGQIPSTNLEKLSSIPKEMRSEYLKESGASAGFQKAVDAALPIVNEMAKITFKEGALKGALGGKSEKYNAMKARIAAEVIEKVPGIRSDADFRNIIEPQLPSPSDDNETANFKAEQFKRWIQSKKPSTPISDTYFGTQNQAQKVQQTGASGSWDEAPQYESLSDADLEKLYQEKIGGRK
jgi:hypothetical protein